MILVSLVFIFVLRVSPPRGFVSNPNAILDIRSKGFPIAHYYYYCYFYYYYCCYYYYYGRTTLQQNRKRHAFECALQIL